VANYCCNSLIISGNYEDLKKFDNQFKSKHLVYEQFFLTNPLMKYNFDNLVKMGNGTLEVFINEDKTTSYIKREREGYSFENFVPKKTPSDVIGWDNFNRTYWGVTKDLDPDSFTSNREDIVDGFLYYSFTTVWCDCEELVLAMSKQFPKLEIEYTYEEDGEELAGSLKFAVGECTESYKSRDFDDYRVFKSDYLNAEYLKCADCGHYIEESEYDDEGCCPECESKNILGIDHKTPMEAK